MGTTNRVIFGLLAAVTLSFTGCATDPDYYEGEVVPTRPVGKPGLNTDEPSTLTGSTGNTDLNPGINETKLPGVDPTPVRYDGRTEWAEELVVGDREYVYIHNPDYDIGVDHIDVIDESGATVQQFDTKIDVTQVDSTVVRR
jgi:hypothetical protein